MRRMDTALAIYPELFMAEEMRLWELAELSELGSS